MEEKRVRVAIVSENSLSFINTLLDIWNKNCSAVLIDYRIPFKVIYQMLISTDVEICYIMKKYFDSSYLNERIKFIFIDNDGKNTNFIPNEIYQKFRNNYSLEEALILFSSGTTGISKGISLSHYAIQTNADLIIKRINTNLMKKMYIIKPFAHSSSIVGELLVALKLNISAIISSSELYPRMILKNIIDNSISTIFINPTILKLLIEEYERKKYFLDSLKSIYVSGAILTEELHKKATLIFRNINIFNMYGLTELGPRVSMQDVEHNKFGSVGKVLDNIDVIILDENGQTVGKNDRGIIYVKSPCEFSNYVINSQEKIKVKGYLLTGDVGYFDNNNELFIVGRNDEIIIQGSHNIYPYDIEKIIYKLPFIVENYVFAVPDEVYGQKIICFCITDSNDFEFEYKKLIRRKCLEELSLYEIPKEIYIVRDIPKNKNGKISKYSLIEMYYKIIGE